MLANMTLDGIEKILVDKYKTKNGKIDYHLSNIYKVNFCRYADDFIVTAKTEEIAKEVKELIADFLKERGLELSEEKTLITNIDKGFDFLGWNFRKYKGKLLVKPSKKSIDKITENISDTIKRGKAWTQGDLIKTLNPIIAGWSNYHRSVVSSEIFRNLDSRIWGMLWHWAKRRHPEKSKQWIVNKYWLSVGKRNWVFSDGTNKLNLLSDTKIVRHIRLKLDMNPHLDKEYFDSRRSRLKVKKTTSITEKVIGIAEKATDVAKKTLDKVKNICKSETVTMTNNCCPNKGL